jgi:ABC-type lipopolysaccharide export system ATPase subunit
MTTDRTDRTNRTNRTETAFEELLIEAELASILPIHKKKKRSSRSMRTLIAMLVEEQRLRCALRDAEYRLECEKRRADAAVARAEQVEQMLIDHNHRRI